jgi:nitrogen fixation NifU-like protein
MIRERKIETMVKKSNGWKDLYKKKDEEEPELPEGPVLFYNELVIDHFSNPRNVGEMPDADGYALVGDPSCGDQMKLWITVKEGRISDIKFKSFGCPGAIATSSMATVLTLDKTLAEAKLLTDDDVILALGGIPENKRHCSLMGVNALLAAIYDYEKKQEPRNPV